MNLRLYLHGLSAVVADPDWDNPERLVVLMVDSARTHPSVSIMEHRPLLVAAVSSEGERNIATPATPIQVVAGVSDLLSSYTGQWDLRGKEIRVAHPTGRGGIVTNLTLDNLVDLDEIAGVGPALRSCLDYPRPDKYAPVAARLVLEHATIAASPDPLGRTWDFHAPGKETKTEAVPMAGSVTIDIEVADDEPALEIHPFGDESDVCNVWLGGSATLSNLPGLGMKPIGLRDKKRLEHFAAFYDLTEAGSRLLRDERPIPHQNREVSVPAGFMGATVYCPGIKLKGGG
ncbi:MAG: hypothetical protein D6738_13655 [Acidobacteria bacterium]|nr:MAG: hypothetical protein D6738_13655 [Acidobacteriota bacterium]